MKKLNLFYLIVIIGIVLDLFTKYIAKIYLQKQINIFSDFLFLKYTENTGIAFSINIPYIKILTIILIIGIFYYYVKYEKNKNDKFINISFGFIIAGAIGNGVERIFNSKVIDFIGVKYFSVFNLADIFINIGVIIYLFYLFREFFKKNN